MPDSIVPRLRHFAGSVVKQAAISFFDLKVQVSDSCTIFGAAFGKGHHLVRTLKAYEKNNAIPLEETALYDHLKHFSPASTEEALLGEAGESVLPLFVYPWGTFRKGENVSGKSAENSRFCGPSSDLFIREEYDRTIRLYERLKREGYLPGRYPHSFVGGTRLERRSGKSRFVVLQGNHRVAVLSALGATEIRHWPLRGFVSVLREADIPKWPLVQSGKCSHALAQRVFDAYFADQSDRIAETAHREKLSRGGMQ